MKSRSGRTARQDSPFLLARPERMVANVHTNVSQELIQVTEDKLKLILVQHSLSLTKRDAWISPLSLFIPTITTLMTARFEDYIVSGDIWQAIFIVSSAISGFWLIKALFSRPKKNTIDEIVDQIKGKQP